MAKSLLIVLAFMFIMVSPIAIAMEIDNIKSSVDTKGGAFSLGDKDVAYNSIWNKYKPVKVTNRLGLGKTLLQGAITEHDDFCGEDCSSTMQIYLGEDSVLIDAIDFYTIKNDGARVKENIRNYQFYVDGAPYNIGDEMPSGTYEVRLDGEKKSSKTVDWVIKTQGETLNSWAVWGGVSQVGVDYQLIIIADSVTGATGNVTVTQLSTTIWKVNTTNTDNEISRAEVMRWLFYGTDGSNPRATSTYITNPSAVYTNDTRDIGKRGIYAFITASSTTPYKYYTGNFSNTATNTYVSSWSQVSVNYNDVAIIATYEMPLATALNTQTGVGTTDEIGTNKVADQQDNPATVRLGGKDEYGSKVASVKAVILSNGNITWVASPAPNTYNNTDFYIDESFPLFSYADASITLNSPIDDYISNTNLVQFNCTAAISGGSTITNISFWNNITGTWANNQTHSITGTTNSTTFNLSIPDGSFIDWTCSSGDSDGVTGMGAENRTVSVDTSSPTINITYPTTSFDYLYPGQNISLNWTSSDINLESCWYNYNNTNSTVPCASNNASIRIEPYNQSITFYANDSVGNVANFTRSWTTSLFANSQTYNLTTYETAAEGYRINLTSNSSQTVTANLIYDGASYTGTKVGNNTNMEFYKSITVPLVSISTPQNKSFYWNITYGSSVIAGNINNQSVGRIALGLCNATLTVPYINFTFEDEESLVSTNASIDTSSWTYYLSDSSVNRTLLYSTTDANESYGFCFSPPSNTLYSDIEIQYSDTGYPQRRWSSSPTLTNTTTNQKLYMLASTDGTYSVYQVQNTVGSGIQNVEVTAERQFDGVWTLVEQGLTDSAGGFTGWLNPDYDHRLTFTKEGYTTVQVTVRPSSSLYTVIMSAGASDAVYNSSIEGLSWSVYPPLGATLFPNTTQEFLFNLTSNLSNVVSCKMEIINNNSVSLGSIAGCNSEGGNLTISVPLGMNRSVRAVYSVDIGSGYIILDADAYWIIMTTNIPERGTIVAFFKYVKNLNEFGSDNNRQEYSRVVFFFLMLSIVMGSISYSTGWDFSTAGGAMGFMTFIIIIASYGGFLSLSYTGVNGFMDKYVVALITSLITGGFILNKMAREA